MYPNPERFLDSMHRWTEIFMRRTMRLFIQYAKDNGLSMSQINAMFYMHRKGSCGVSDIGDDLGISSAAASQMLDKLVLAGFISRTEDPQDRRLKHIVLTDTGSTILHAGIQARQSWLQDLAVILTPGEKDQISTALNILIDKADQLEQLPDTGP